MRRELLLLALAIVDMQISHAIKHGVLEPTECSAVLATYMDALCTFELKVPYIELYELMRDRLPIYYKAFDDRLNCVESDRQQRIGPIAKAFAIHCGLSEPLTHEGFAALCAMEVICQLDVVASTSER